MSLAPIAVIMLKSGAPLKVWADQRGRNLAFETSVGNADATKQAFAQAARTVSLTIVNQRLVTNYMDTRGVIAEYDEAEDHLYADARQPGSATSSATSSCKFDVLKIPPGQDARHQSGYRRRLRHQAFPVSRICAGGGRGRSACSLGVR